MGPTQVRIKMKYLISFVFFINILYAKDSFLNSVHRMKWNLGPQNVVDVVWIEDDKFPKFTASIYFQDGAVNDLIPGLTQTTFDQMSSGTSTESQRQLADFFDFYGANIRNTVTHEYSIVNIQALVKDIRPVVGKVCELFEDAQYPKDELISHISRSKSHLKNLITSHAAIADRIFRRVSLEGTPYAAPVEGTIQSFDKINPEELKLRLKTLKQSRKVLYLAGPKSVLDIRDVIANKCNWTNESKVIPLVQKKPLQQSSIYLVEVPNANQAQIRIGRYMTASEFQNKNELFHFMSGFLGGGFTSKLVQELRVKRGLTYSAGAYTSMQRDYGRAGVSTFSKNETAAESILLIRDIFNDVSSGKFENSEFTHQKNHQMGGHAFAFEETSAFLAQLMLYDHQNRDLEELEKFTETISKLTKTELSSATMEAFPWDRLTIVVVGNKSLVQSLSRIRPVKILKLEDYL